MRRSWKKVPGRQSVPGRVFGTLSVYCLLAAALGAAETDTKVLIAFTSFREQSRHPEIYFYEHDGVSAGRITGKIAPATKRSDHHPALSLDGRLCCFAAEQEGQISRIHCWDLAQQAAIELPHINETPNTQMAPAYAAGAGLLCFEAWNRPDGAGRWDLMQYDLPGRQLGPGLKLNTPAGDERKPSISSDGRWIAYTSNADAASSLTEILVFDRQSGQSIKPAALNSPAADTEPALSADGRWLAFVSDRAAADPDRTGIRDIYLYDRTAEQLVPLPGINSVGQEQSPALSQHGRFVAFVSERLAGAGERDIYLYDRQTQRLLPTPELNSPRDEYDPCLVVLAE